MTARTPVEKLPLAARKNLRDDFENNRESLEKQISDLLGEQWKIDVNPNLLYAYADADSWAANNPGSCIKGYVEGAIWQLKRFVESHGADGAAEINRVASTHTITIAPDVEKKNSYCGVDIADGVLRILFTEGNLGTNIDYALEKLEPAVNEASKAGEENGLSYSTRNGIRAEWTSQLEELKKKLVTQLHNDALELIPNFEANAAALKAAGKNASREDWEERLGVFTRNYFEGLEWQLRNKNFANDDMLYEGFNEAVSTGKIGFRVVDKIEKSYGEVVIEDGVLWIQVKPDTFGVNIDYIAEGIVDLL
ncbi:hypothetical protein HK097_000827 [Rhizophlyctis rosea]|uniref:Uncharacterized protein n=1 Tax=Rhizophlyctis rosea TaxID=64517 RepID=A0AAD5SHR0_9FUNG|nr:hypothetical protein HK097_000827 [Rhizophlyctis rosea]